MADKDALAKMERSYRFKCFVCSSGIPGKVVQDAVAEVVDDFNTYSRLSFEGRERISR